MNWTKAGPMAIECPPYIIAKLGPDWDLRYMLTCNSKRLGYFDSADAAKAAARKHKEGK